MEQGLCERISALEEGFCVGAWTALPHSNNLFCQTLVDHPVGRAVGEQAHAGNPEPVHVNSKAMQVLVLLAAHAGEFVSKDQLLATVWANRVVTEDVLTGAVRTLRKAMRDDARNPHLIETRKGAGYRVIADVHLASPAAPVSAARTWGLGVRHALVSGVVLLGAALMYVRFVPDSQQPTVAVLPFSSMSVDRGDEFVAGAITDGLIMTLAQQSGLRVISRTSTLPYASTDKSLPAIAKALGAEYLVEGSVLADGARVRITAQLIHASDDIHVWASRYDRPFNDVLKVQSEVADQIARRIVHAVAVPAPPPVSHLSGDALERYLRARYWLALEQPASTEQALVIFRQLSEQYPSDPGPHLGKAQAQLQLFKQYRRAPQVLRSAEASVRLSLKLDASSSVAYGCLAQVVFYDRWDFTAAEGYYQEAIELNPNDTVARRRYAWLLVARERFDEALVQIGEVKRLDPHYYASTDGAMLLMFAGEFQAAVRELERVAAAQPDLARTQRVLSLAYWGLREYDKSATALVATHRLSDISADAEAADELATVLETDGRAGVFRYLLKAKAFTSPVARAGLYAQLGDQDAALSWLEQAVSSRDPQVPFLAARPEFFALHEDPRFQALVARIDDAPRR